MAHGVFHKELGPINLSELDLNVREDRLLWESMYGKTAKGDLECLECRENDPGCPQWMFLRLWKGRPVAVHYSTDRRHPTAPLRPCPRGCSRGWDPAGHPRTRCRSTQGAALRSTGRRAQSCWYVARI